jgi:DNA-directed RNA polymerase specialized sigma24 family protein
VKTESWGRDETAPGGQGKWFATTHWSVVLAASQDSSPEAPAALEKLCRCYWFPLYSYVRRQGYGPHDAQDLTQGFFGQILGQNFVAEADREKGKFRSFLLGALNHFLGHERGRARAVKRGGGRVFISLEEKSAEELYGLEPATSLSPEHAFEKRWAITVLERALARVSEEFLAEGKARVFARLQPFLVEGTAGGDYSAAAADLRMKPNAVAVAVHRLRQRYRQAVREEIAHTVATPQEIEEEMRYLLRALAR